MPSSLSAVQVERYLDRFPLAEQELEQLVQLYNDVKPTSKIFVDVFPLLPELEVIYQYVHDKVFVIASSSSSSDASSDPLFDRFLETCVSLCGRRGDRILGEALAVVGQQSSGDHTSVDTHHVMSFLYRLLLVAYNLPNDGGSSGDEITNRSNQPTTGWMKSLSPDLTTTVSLQRWNEWTEYVHVHRALIHVCVQPLHLPVLVSLPPLLLLATIPETLALAATTLMLPIRQSLYDSDVHGLAFRSFQQALLDYVGPTLLVVHTTQQQCVGYYTQVPWKTSPKWFTGQGDALLVTLSPNWRIYPLVKESKRNFHQYLNLSTHHHPHNTELRGLAVGGVAADSPRFYLSESLEHCRVMEFDTVFESGSLLDKCFFDVDRLQVWAVAESSQQHEECLRMGKVQASMRERMRLKHAVVDRKEFVSDLVNLPGRLFEHRDQVRGRADLVADDEGKGYFVEDKRPTSPKETEEV